MKYPLPNCEADLFAKQLLVQMSDLQSSKIIETLLFDEDKFNDSIGLGFEVLSHTDKIDNGIELPKVCLSTPVHNFSIKSLDKKVYFIELDNNDIQKALNDSLKLLSSGLIKSTIICSKYCGLIVNDILDLSETKIDIEKRIIYLGNTDLFSSNPKLKHELFLYGSNGEVGIHLPNGMITGTLSEVVDDGASMVIMNVKKFSNECFFGKRKDIRVNIFEEKDLFDLLIAKKLILGSKIGLNISGKNIYGYIVKDSSGYKLLFYNKDINFKFLNLLKEKGLLVSLFSSGENQSQKIIINDIQIMKSVFLNVNFSCNGSENIDLANYNNSILTIQEFLENIVLFERYKKSKLNNLSLNGQEIGYLLDLSENGIGILINNSSYKDIENYKKQKIILNVILNFSGAEISLQIRIKNIFESYNKEYYRVGVEILSGNSMLAKVLDMHIKKQEIEMKNEVSKIESLKKKLIQLNKLWEKGRNPFK